jgi:hypothetical protein
MVTVSTISSGRLMENELVAKSNIKIEMSMLLSTRVVAWQRHATGTPRENYHPTSGMT